MTRFSNGVRNPLADFDSRRFDPAQKNPQGQPAGFHFWAPGAPCAA